MKSRKCKIMQCVYYLCVYVCVCVLMCTNANQHIRDTKLMLSHDQTQNEFLIKYSHAIYLNAFSLKRQPYLYGIVQRTQYLSECGLSLKLRFPPANGNGIGCLWCWLWYWLVVSVLLCAILQMRLIIGLHFLIQNIWNGILIGFVTCPLHSNHINHKHTHSHAHIERKMNNI